MSTDLASSAVRALDGPAGWAPRMALHEYLRETGMRSFVLGTSKDPNAKVTVLLFRPGTDRPQLAVKIPTTDAAAASVEAEGRLLVELRRRRLRDALASIPRVVDLVEFEGRAAIVTTAVAGAPMTTSYLEWRHTAKPSLVRADFAVTERWLEAFQGGTATDLAPIDLVGGTPAGLESRFGDDPDIGADLERLSQIEVRLRRYRTPRTAVHGDFWPGNLLESNGRISGVVDWEMGAVSGEPLRDLIRFAHMYALYLDRHTRRGRRVVGHPGLRAGVWGAGAIHALNGKGWFSSLFRDFLQRGLLRLGAPPDCWCDAFLAGVAEVAATTDDPKFAREHLTLFRRLTSVTPAGETKNV